MSMKSFKVVFLGYIVIFSLIYLIIWVYNDIPPRIQQAKFPTKEDINIAKFSEEEVNAMSKALNNAGLFEKICITKYLQARDKKLVDFCYTGGSFESVKRICNLCFEGMYVPIDNFNALEYCKIEWR